MAPTKGEAYMKLKWISFLGCRCIIKNGHLFAQQKHCRINSPVIVAKAQSGGVNLTF